MTRRQVKRLLALIKAEIDYGRNFDLELPEGFKESFENQPEFKGWINYHVTWDVSDSDVWKAVVLKKSRVAIWHEQLRKRLPVITSKGVVSAEEYAEMEKVEKSPKSKKKKGTKGKR